MKIFLSSTRWLCSGKPWPEGFLWKNAISQLQDIWMSAFFFKRVNYLIRVNERRLLNALGFLQWERPMIGDKERGEKKGTKYPVNTASYLSLVCFLREIDPSALWISSYWKRSYHSCLSQKKRLKAINSQPGPVPWFGVPLAIPINILQSLH